MYRKHKYCIGITFGVIFVLTFILKLEFEDIASDCISIVSFALAIYAICISSLIRSPLLERLRGQVDSECTTRTQLGVIKAYIKNAMIVAVITLIMACMSKLEIGLDCSSIFQGERMQNIIDLIHPMQLYSSLCFSFFILNFVFIILIFVFIVSRQVA